MNEDRVDPDLRITRVETFLFNPGSTRNLLFCRIETDGGLHGWGEAYVTAEKEKAVDEYLKAMAPHLIGRSAVSIRHTGQVLFDDFVIRRSSIGFLSAWAAIEMTTLGGARALGLESTIGTIETGKSADLVAMDLSAPETQPEHHVHSQVVYAANSRQFSHSWVAGQLLMKDGELTTLDRAAVVDNARAWDERLAVRAA